LLGLCPPDLWTGHVHWVASLFLSCLGVGCSIGEAIAGMMGQTKIPLDTELTVVRDCLVWKPYDSSRLPRLARGHGEGGWLHCSCGWSAVGLGRLPGGFLWRLWSPLASPIV